MKSRTTRTHLALSTILLSCLGGAVGCADSVGPADRGAAVERASETEDLKEDESAGGVALGLVLEGLTKPFVDLIGEGTTGKVIELLFGEQSPDYSEQFTEVNARLDRLEVLSKAANDRLTALEAQLSLTRVELENAGFDATLSGPTNHIESLYSGNASGGVDGCNPHTAVSSSLCWYFAPDRTPATKKLGAPDFVAAVDPALVLSELGQINGAICPSDGKATALLDNYADLVRASLDPATGDVAQPLDAIESRFVALVRTQIHGLQVLAAYYQFQAQLDASKADIAKENLTSALTAYRSNFAREADAYLAATARYAAVAGGDPNYLVKDAASGAFNVAPALVARLGRAPAIADAVRKIGADLAATYAPTPPAQDVVHAVFLARQTDVAFGGLTVSATVAADRSRTASVDIGALSKGSSYLYSGAGAGRELHTQGGRYGAFVRSSPTADASLELSDGWWVYDVNLALPGSGAAGNVEVVVTTAGKSAFYSKTLSVAPAFAPSAGKGAVYIVADDFRMDGPTSRVDLFKWASELGAGGAACTCSDYDWNLSWMEDQGKACPVGPTLSGSANAAGGVVAGVGITTGRSVEAGCNMQQTMTVKSTFLQNATNAVVYGATSQLRTADTVKWSERGPFAIYKDLELTCDNDKYWFGEWYYAPHGANAITLGGLSVDERDGKLFTDEMPTSCDQDYDQTVWFKLESTLADMSNEALASRTGLKWESGVKFLKSAPQTFAAGTDSSLTVKAAVDLPSALSKVNVETRLLSFGIYVP